MDIQGVSFILHILVFFRIQNVCQNKFIWFKAKYIMNRVSFFQNHFFSSFEGNPVILLISLKHSVQLMQEAIITGFFGGFNLTCFCYLEVIVLQLNFSRCVLRYYIIKNRYWYTKKWRWPSRLRKTNLERKKHEA